MRAYARGLQAFFSSSVFARTFIRYVPERVTFAAHKDVWQIPVLWTPLRFQVGPEVNVFKRAVNT